MQTTNSIVLIRPVAFRFNEQTAVNNAFQQQSRQVDVNEQARNEFDHFEELLRKNHIDVTVIEDTEQPETPDSIFPNNWVSFHDDGTVVLYPMFAPNRREERAKGCIEKIAERFSIKNRINLTKYEDEGTFLEGTGSLVLDRENRIAYACFSPRTHPGVLKKFCDEMNYTPVSFYAKDAEGSDIYHTNVMMCIADQYAVVCMESITNRADREKLTAALQRSGKEIIEITPAQMKQFAGNMLQLHDKDLQKLLVMSTRAFQSLTPAQIEKLESYNRIIHAPLYAIEQNGGGSARCMIAEVFLPEKFTSR